MSDTLKGVAIASKKAVHRLLIAPWQRRRWAAAREPFDHRTPEGLTFRLYPHEYVDSFIYQFGIYERQYLDFLLKVLPRDAVMLDIGANIGNHALYLAPHIAAIHAFEPNPVTFARLKHNVTRNALDDRITLHHIGLGDDEGMFRFASNVSGNLGASGFLRDDAATDARVEVIELPIRRADDYVAGLDLSRIDFVKMDVEGWEASVFRGLAGTIARYRPIVAFEYHGHEQPRSDFDAIAAALPGYIIVDPTFAAAKASYAAKALWAIRRAGWPELRRVTEPEPRTYESLLAFPDEEMLARFDRGD
ncbi:MAG: FkbM family methyltransferase [Sphingomonas phyllosphaerae]